MPVVNALLHYVAIQRILSMDLGEGKNCVKNCVHRRSMWRYRQRAVTTGLSKDSAEGLLFKKMFSLLAWNLLERFFKALGPS